MTSLCPICREMVPGGTPILHSGVFLSKTCKKCGVNTVKIESDAHFFHRQETLPRTTSQNDCYMIDITGKCTAGCKRCYNRGGEDRHLTDFARELLQIPTGSRVLISGGEPLEHANCAGFIEMAAIAGMKPVLLTNGAGLTPRVMAELLDAGLHVDGVPQVSVSLGLPGYNRTHKQVLENLKQVKVAMIAFTVADLSDLDTVQALAEQLDGQFDSICIRTAWDGSTPGLYLSDIARYLGGELLRNPTLHGYRNAQIIKHGIQYNLLSWPTWGQWDADRYAGRGVWYQGDNVVNTLVKRHVAALPM